MNLFTNELTAKPEWMDHNGHMNVAYFVLAFDVATDAVYEEWGIGQEYPENSGCSVFTLGVDVDYYAEVFAGDQLKITTQLLDWDYKRLHYYHRMYLKNSNKLAATNECLVMNVDLTNRCSAEFSAEIQHILSEVNATHKSLPRPEKSGRRLLIPKKA